MKALSSKNAHTLTDIPNIGPSMIDKFSMLDIHFPQDLKKHDPYVLYTRLCTITGKRYDPCVLDTFMAAIDFMNGNEPKPWWYFTESRKQLYPNI